METTRTLTDEYGQYEARITYKNTLFGRTIYYLELQRKNGKKITKNEIGEDDYSLLAAIIDPKLVISSKMEIKKFEFNLEGLELEVEQLGSSGEFISNKKVSIPRRIFPQ